MYKKATTTVRLFTSLVILAAVCMTYLGTPVISSVYAKTNARPKAAKALKISPQLRGGNHAAGEQVRVIVELSGTVSGRLNALLNRNGVHMRKQLQTLRSFSIDMPYGMVAELSSFPEVFHVSINSKITSLGHVTATTGTDAGRAAAAQSNHQGAIDGAGIGIAILDSGIDTGHVQFSGASGASRVLASVDFTGENRTHDPYAHATHLAAAPSGTANAGAAYLGIAPGASLLNVRVLNAQGQGTIEGVMAGVLWGGEEMESLKNVSLQTRFGITLAGFFQ